MKVKATCHECGGSFERYKTPKGHDSLKYCSHRCASTVNVKNLGTRMAGRKMTPEQVDRMRKGKRLWWSTRLKKKIGYQALHNWVTRNKGRPMRCEHCGTTDSKRKYDWACISRQYKRDLADYQRLCRQCHWKYDGRSKN